MTGKLLLSLGVFLALAVAKTYPLILNLDTRTASDPGDPLLNAWILAWDAHALAANPLRLFDANIFYPVERSLAFSDHLLGLLPVFAPVYALTGNPLAAYNTLLLLSFALSGTSAFALCYYWTRAFWPALVGGALFGFAPFRFGQLGHLQILSFFWAPAALVFLDRFLRTRRWPDLAGFAIFFWLQVLSSVYLAYMTAVASALYAGYHVVTADRGLLRRSVLPKVLTFAGGSIAVLLPLYLPYLAVRRTWDAYRRLGEVSHYSPDLLSYLTAPHFMNDLYVAALTHGRPWAAPEKWLFPGLVLPALVIIGSGGVVSGLARAEARRLRQVFLAIAGLAVLISLGPYLIVLGQETQIPLPYLLLYHVVPGFAGLRVPGRFVLLAVLAVTPLAALGALRCSGLVGRWFGTGPRARVAAPLTAAGLIGIFLLELGWKPLPLVKVLAGPDTPEVYHWLAATRPGPIAEIPFGRWDDYQYLFLSTVHWLPLANGQSGFFPPTYTEIQQALAELPAKRAVEYAGALGIKAVVVHSHRLRPGELNRWGDAKIIGSGLKKIVAFGPDEVYSVPPIPATSSLRARLATPDRLPARERFRLGLLLSPDDARPWAHPRPHGKSEAVIHWTDPSGTRTITATRRLQLPPVILSGETVPVPVIVRSPAAPASYLLRISIPSAGVHADPRSVELLATTLPTSRDAPGLLAATYVRRHGDGPLIVGEPSPVPLEILATNTGKAVWLAEAGRDSGAVRLGWRWFKDGREISELSGRVPIRYDVFPGQAYRFRVSIEALRDAGSYTLEVGLVSEHVAWFSDVGTPPLRFAVRIPAGQGQTFADLLERLRSPVPNAPRLALSDERVGNTSRLSVEWAIGLRSWFVNVYLALEGPDGVLWFHDGRELTLHTRGPWIPVGRGIELRKGSRGAGPLANLPLSRMRSGSYTWYLVLTEPDSYRIIAQASRRFEITP